MLIVITICAGGIFLVNLWLKRHVVKPIKRMTQIAKAVSQGDMKSEFRANQADEIGSLAEAFMLMKISLAIALDRLGRLRKKDHS
ncbi:MAG: HAMP domain-containing protein [Cyanobacteria bacterium J06642_3]